MGGGERPLWSVSVFVDVSSVEGHIFWPAARGVNRPDIIERGFLRLVFVSRFTWFVI